MAGSGTSHLRPDQDPLLRVDHLTVDFPVRGGRGHRREVVRAVTDVSFDVNRGETLGIVGESGCGKSTTGRAIMQLPPPTAGTVTFDGIELTALRGEALRAIRPRLQLIFQDPISSLNPRRRVGDIVGEPCASGGATVIAMMSSPRRSRRSDSIPRSPVTSDRTSSPGASASASPSPARWCSTRNC